MQNKPIANQAHNTNLIIDNRGCAYSDGFFSTMGVYQGSILWLWYHEQRLADHARALQLDIDLASVVAQLQKHASQINEGIVKIVITRSNQAIHQIKGYGFATGTHGRQAEVFIKPTAQPMTHYHQLSASQSLPIYQLYDNNTRRQQHALCLTSQLAHLPKPLVGLKSLNRLDSVLVAGELEQAKMSKPLLIEGLVSDVTGHWVEGVMGNTFYTLCNSDQWYTPPIDCSGVQGIMRQVVIDNYADNNQRVIERRLTNDDLMHITRLFFCNAVKGIIPIDTLWLANGQNVVLDTSHYS